MKRIAIFGPFRVDRQSRELWKHGQKIPLQGRPFRLLDILLDHAGDVVPRDQLRLALWDADTFVDVDNGLHTAAAKLREALGDSAAAPVYVDTVPRVGYRFVAAVHWQNAEDITPGLGDSRIFRAHSGVVRLAVAGMAALWLAVGIPTNGRDALAGHMPAAALTAFQDGVFLASADGRSGDALAAFDRALSIAPGFARARAARARALTDVALRSAAPDKFVEARDQARLALRTDPGLADAHLALSAAALYFEWDLHTAVSEAVTAAALTPDSAAAQAMLATALNAAGRHDDAVAAAHRAVDLNPTALTRVDLGYFLLAAGRTDEAIAQCQRVIALEADNQPAWRVLLQAAAAGGRTDLGQKAAQQLARLSAAPASLQHALDASARGDSKDGWHLYWRWAAEQLQQDAAAERYPFSVAALWAGAGDTTRALAALDRALIRRDALLVFVGADPAFRSLHQTERFRQVVKQVGVPLG